MKPTFFKTQDEFRAWLQENHDTAQELRVGFHKKGSGKPSISYQEAVDEALCFGWIDGVRHNVNETSYMIRFTPRKPHSIWSQVNIRRVKQLIELERMQAPGLKAFETRDEKKARLYSYERETAKLDGKFEKQFRANKKAWEFFQAQAPWYRRTSTFWVMSAKQEATRVKRLATLISDSANSKRLAMLTRKEKNG